MRLMGLIPGIIEAVHERADGKREYHVRLYVEQETPPHYQWMESDASFGVGQAVVYDNGQLMPMPPYGVNP